MFGKALPRGHCNKRLTELALVSPEFVLHLAVSAEAYRSAVSAIDVASSTSDPGLFRVVDSLPGGLTFVRRTGEDVACTASGREVTSTFVGALPSNASRSVLIDVRVLPWAPLTIVNTVEALSLYTRLSDAPVTDSDSGQLISGLSITGATPSFVVLLTAAIACILGVLLVVRGRRRDETTPKWTER